MFGNAVKTVPQEKEPIMSEPATPAARLTSTESTQYILIQVGEMDGEGNTSVSMTVEGIDPKVVPELLGDVLALVREDPDFAAEQD